MKSLKAFLCHRESSGTWTTSVFRELEELLAAWHAVYAANASGAVMHVGFWRPDSAALGALAEMHPRLLLLSAAALHALPGRVTVSKQAVGSIDGLDFWLVRSGFGYELPSEFAAEVPSPHEGIPSTGIVQDWLADLVDFNPDLLRAIASAGIWDDRSYAEREGALDCEVRQQLGLARYRLLTHSEPSDEDIIDNIRACPAWLRATPLHHLRLTVRQANVFRAHGLATVGDVGGLATVGLFKLNNLGRKSVSELAIELHRALRDGPVPSLFDLSKDKAPVTPPSSGAEPMAPASKSVAAWTSGVRMAMVDAMRHLGGNERSVLIARMGFECPQQTLQEIAETLGVTRERVRQIEVKVCKLLRSQSRWLEMEQRLLTLLEGRANPLLLDGLSAFDEWFEGAASLRDSLQFIFDRVLERRLHVLDAEGALCVSRLSQDEWHSEVQAAKHVLEHAASSRPLEAEVRCTVEGLLVARGEELRADLWSCAAQTAHFADMSDGTRRLVSFGKSAEVVVHAILSRSDVPLHYSEIQKRAVLEGDSSVDVRRIHNAAANVAILFARGTYGLPQHCPLDAAEMEAVRVEVEDLMYDEAPDRQWHCMELCDALVERGMGFDERLSKYVVNLALKDSPRLACLGRLVWGLAGSWRKTTSSRIDVRQAVISLLEREGHPLTTAQIRSRIEMERGVNVHFQIYPSEPLVRVGPGLWGLSNRDLDLGGQTAQEILHVLKKRLLVLGRGIHLSEVGSQLNAFGGVAIDMDINPYWIATYAKHLELRIDKSQYVYLQEWGGSRRLSIHDSVKAALAEAGAPGASLDDVCNRATELSLRKCSTTTISQTLQAIGAAFDDSTALWSSGASVLRPEIEEDLYL